MMVPISRGTWNNNIQPEGYVSKGQDDTLAYFNRVSPGFFETLRTPLLLGRDFNDHDDLGAPKVMIINETAARRYFGHSNAIGKTIAVPVPGDEKKQDVFQVIGVVRDAKYENVSETMLPGVYLACAQDDEPWPGVNFEIRSEQPVEAFTSRSSQHHRDLQTAPDGLLIHTAGFYHDAGVFRIFDVWETREQGEKFITEKLNPIIEPMAAEAAERAETKPSRRRLARPGTNCTTR